MHPTLPLTPPTPLSPHAAASAPLAASAAGTHDGASAHDASPDAWLDLAGLMPPLPLEVSARAFARTGGDSSGAHTFVPGLVSEEEFSNLVAPALRESAPPDLLKYITARVKKTFDLRRALARLRPEIERIVGEGNFSALWLDREAFSADSMEHRALITEAVIHVYSCEALQELVTLLYANDVPMIPYGEGGGYNMGVTPMAPAVTVSVRGIDHVSAIRPSRRTPGRYEISVGAGVPFKDLQAYLHKRGYVLRCDPNTPRAATGGIAATGSNAGRKAWEVVLAGRAVTVEGTAVRFEADLEESARIATEPFLMARKFFSVDSPPSFGAKLAAWRKRAPRACTEPSSEGIVVPLVGMKAGANMAAQRAGALGRANTGGDTMQGPEPLPISTFVGAEGCTGFIYEVTFELEKPLPYLRAARWHFAGVEAAMVATRAIKSLPSAQQPVFFELITGQSIRRYLLQDFPGVFDPSDEAVLFVAAEGPDARATEALLADFLARARVAIADAGHAAGTLTRTFETGTMKQSEGVEEFERLRKPREELPKKLRTKCKTDMEIRTEYLGEVLRIVEQARPRALAERKQDVLFGHLTPARTAIMHWNIGGFDLYDEEQADVAWDYLETVIGAAQGLAPEGDPHGSARFSGEHGIAGKAPFLWLNHIPEADFARMCAIKDLLDPKDLFNPDTLFLRTSHARSLRARLMNVSNKMLQGTLADARAKSAVGAAESYALSEGLRCTRCNSCKTCPVIDAEHELAREGNRKSKEPVLPSKRNILMFLERVALTRRGAAAASSRSGDAGVLARVEEVTSKMIAESADLLKKCFYCRRCDKACPVDIEIHPLMRAYHAMGKLPSMGSRLWGFLYERLMGEDSFKQFTYRLIALFTLLGRPFLRAFRRLAFPDWVKTYTVPPTLSLTHYEPAREGARLKEGDNFVLVSPRPHDKRFSGQARLAPKEVYIRYRGCMDTFGNPAATTSVDSFFKDVLDARIVDLEKKMCCGFPFEADGLHERAEKSRLLSMVEIARCVSRLVEEWRADDLAYGAAPLPKFTVFSNCPTCCEAIREMKTFLVEPEKRELLRVRAGLPPSFDFALLDFDVRDTAEIAVTLLDRAAKAQEETGETLAKPLPRARKTVGLKVPCHNTKGATEAQLALLGMYYTGVAAYDRCCGLSGTGRLKHPRIGTKIAEKLFEQIREKPAEVVVSGCPSCRDGVSMQREILAAKEDAVADFKVAGLFESILADCQPAGAKEPEARAAR